MFGLIEMELIPRPSLWGRIRCKVARDTGVTLTEERAWGVLLARVQIQLWCEDVPDVNERRVRCGLAALRDVGARGVVLPRGFPYSSLLADFGLVASTPVPLYRRMAARLASYVADMMCVEPSQLKLAIIAKRASPDVMAATEDLCGRARYISLSLSHNDGGPLCRVLRRNYGVSVVENPTDEQLADTDLFLIFDADTPDRHIPAKPGAAVLLLGGGRFLIPPHRLVVDGAQLSPPLRLHENWPWYADNEALLTALLAGGAVYAPEIQILGLTWQGTPVAYA